MLGSTLEIEVLGDTHCHTYGIEYRPLHEWLSQGPGMVFPVKPPYLWTGAGVYAEFVIRGHTFQIEGDPFDEALWISPKDGQPHPAEMEEIRQHLEKFTPKTWSTILKDSFPWFSPYYAPDRVKPGDVLMTTAFLLLVLLYGLPDVHGFDLILKWFVFPIDFLTSFLIGLASSWFYHRKHRPTAMESHYIRCWWGFIGSVIAWPLCLIFRPSVAHLAFFTINWSAGLLLAFHVHRRLRKFQKPTQGLE
ncbi:MAG: hypothetical protein V4672_14775 [Verrucomicrobiota bacterium]